jgi:hypothetical protein
MEFDKDVFGTWMGRSSWQDLKDGNWMWAEEVDFQNGGKTILTELWTLERL